jgi:hypothetical protein
VVLPDETRSVRAGAADAPVQWASLLDVSYVLLEYARIIALTVSGLQV